MSANASPSRGLPQEDEDLPTYEETVSSSPRKRYTLKYPQVLSRSVHAIDQDTMQVVATKKVKGLTPTTQQFFSPTGALLWTCRRDMQGFELVFSRPAPLPILVPNYEPPVQAPGEEIEEEEEDRREYVDDDIGTTAVLLDNKSVDSEPEDPPQPTEEAPPPAYEESSSPTQQIKLTSLYPLPFVYTFSLPTGQLLKWLRNQEAKNPENISKERPWTAFMCVDRSTGRVLAEIVHYSKKDSGLGTLVVLGEMEEDMHLFLVCSAIPVVEEYSVRMLRYSSMSTIPI